MKRILIVDDHRDVAMLLHHQLEQQEYEIEEVYNGSQALSRIFEGNFDLVLLDFDMKDIRGDRVLILAREDERLRKLPIIIITCHVELDDRMFRTYGATDVLYKPVASDDLIRIVRKCLESKG